MPKGVPNKRYAPEFKKHIVETMQNEKLSYSAKVSIYGTLHKKLVKYLDYYNNRCIKAKRKGLPPAIHRQQALRIAGINLLQNIV